jgi:hypothetical protein
MDHLRRETLGADAIRLVVLDEGDEMLRMGFIDDVEWILGRVPAERQTALFSAIMPPAIRKIAARHLRDPETIAIETRTRTVPTVAQRYLNVIERQKLDALTRVLEVEAPETALVFVRTKLAAAQVTERLQARGYAAEAMHGDMTQADREAVIRRLRAGQVEVVIATDVAARGLDVERMVRLFVDAGREAGIRPGDIVGAIAGETDIPGRVIGAIDVHARFTFVDIPAEYVDRVIERMRNVQIRGTPITVKLATPQDGRAERRGPPPTRGKGAPRPRRPKPRHAA